MRRAPGSRSAATATCRTGSRPCIRSTARPTGRSCSCCRSRWPSPSSPTSNQAITFSILSGVLQYTFMSINIMMFRKQVAAGLDPARLYASVPSDAGHRAVLPVLRHLLRHLPRLSASQLIAMVAFYIVDLAVVPLLPLPVRAARRPVHDALADAARLLTHARPGARASRRRSIDRGGSHALGFVAAHCLLALGVASRPACQAKPADAEADRAAMLTALSGCSTACAA